MSRGATGAAAAVGAGAGTATVVPMAPSGAAASIATGTANSTCAAGAVSGTTVSGSVIGRAPDSSGRSRLSCSPLNHLAPRRKCHTDATASTNGEVRNSWRKKAVSGSDWRSPIVAIR